MKKALLRTSLFCITAALIAGTAWAQNSSSSSSRDTTGSSSSSSSRSSSLGGIGSSSSSSSSQQSFMATKLMGAKVKSQQGDNLGQVQDVIINPQSGKVEFAVLSSSTSG